MVDMTSSLAGQASVQFRIVGVTDYGNDVHVDNVRLMTD